MKFSSIMPYALCVTTLFFPAELSIGNGVAADGQVRLSNDIPVTYAADYSIMLDEKANALRDMYVENTINGCENVNNMRLRRGYAAAVRAELPGAPVGRHCLYGQTMQLSRAMTELGDTTTIVPRDARQSCIVFKSAMRSKYNAPEYDGCLHEGRMFASDSLYAAARDKYLAQRKIGAETPDSIRNAVIGDFEKRNFNADSLSAGSVLIVPRPNAGRNAFHAIMLLGRGRIEDGKFVADSTGRHIYVGYNRESIGDLFRTYDMSNVFAADIRKIARVSYARELDSIRTMSRKEQLRFLEEHGLNLSDYEKNMLSSHTVQKAACARYFGVRYDLGHSIVLQRNIRQDLQQRFKGLAL